MKLIKQLIDGKRVLFDYGNFDGNCVLFNLGFVSSTDEFVRKVPRDVDYFAFLKEMSLKYSVEKIWEDFNEIYKLTTNEILQDSFDLIDRIVETYNHEDRIKVQRNFVVIYASMVAEERKKNTRLGKRVKALGLHQLLKENFSISEATNFSKNKNWEYLNLEMKKRNI